jgi:hypothetical protein
LQRTLQTMRPKCVVAGPPEKEGPASAATDREANCRSEKFSHRIDTKSRRAAQQIYRAEYQAYDGRTALGSIEMEGGTFTATTASGERCLGAFPGLKAAADAISASHGAGQ